MLRVREPRSHRHALHRRSRAKLETPRREAPRSGFSHPDTLRGVGSPVRSSSVESVRIERRSIRRANGRKALSHSRRLAYAESCPGHAPCQGLVASVPTSHQPSVVGSSDGALLQGTLCCLMSRCESGALGMGHVSPAEYSWSRGALRTFRGHALRHRAGLRAHVQPPRGSGVWDPRPLRRRPRR